MTAVPADEDDGLRVLDTRGCLTLEVLAFHEELPQELQEVVQRHVRACPLCAQQQVTMARALESLRQRRPRLAIPAEAKILARQVVLQCLSSRRPALLPGPTVQGEAPPPARARVVWYGSRAFWAMMMISMGLALAIAIAAALLV